MADTNIIEQLTKALDAFSDSVEKDLEEVRKQKDAVQIIRDDVFNMTNGAYYLRDDSTLILSAPKVIIGNVDANGNLIGGGGGSEVIIRGNSLSLEATGDTVLGGSITSRAASIRNIAVDPGKDGTENTVCKARSEFVNQAQSIVIDSTADEGCFVNSAGGGAPGVTINSETGISVNATPSVEKKTADIEAQSKDLETQIKSLQSTIKNQRKQIDNLLKVLQDTMDGQFSYNDDETALSMGYGDLSELQAGFASQEMVLAGAVKDYISTMSVLAETNYRKKALDEIKNNLESKKADFKTKAIGSIISMNAEYFSLTSIDGDANLRNNVEAGMHIQVPHLDITANEYTGALMADSTINIATQDFTLSTINPALDEKKEKGDIPAVGSVKVTSKDVLVQAIDQELKDQQVQEKALTAEGSIKLRAENISASATDTEGKSTGKLSLNAMKINVASMDVDKETRKDKEMAAGSQMVMLSEKMLMGTTQKSKLIQLAAEKVGVMAKDTAEMQQDGKAVVTLSGGNMTAGGSKVELQGNTTIAGNADIKGEAKAPKVTSDQVEAKSAFKSPNINDTMGAGVPGQAGSPSAKMTEEEIKTEE